MKKLLSILTISTLTASVPAPLLANAPLARDKRNVITPNSNNDYVPIKEINGIRGYVNSIAFDKQNNIYFGTVSGLYLLKKGSTTSTQINDFLGKNVSSIAFDSKENIYIGTNSGTYKLSAGSTKSIKIAEINSYVYSISIDSKDNIYIAWYNGIHKLSAGSNTPTKIDGINDSVNLLAVDSKDNVYIATNKGLYKLSAGSNTPTKIDGISYDMYSLAIDKENNIYFGKFNGVFVLKQGEKTPTKINEILEFVGVIIIDKQDNIYFGTGKDAYKLSAGSDTPTKIDGIGENVSSIAFDKQDNIYFGGNDWVKFTTTVLDWTKQQSQFNLVDNSKTKTWTRPDLLSVDGKLNIGIANPNIDKVLFDNVQQGQTNKQWKINVKPETSEKDHNLQVTFTLDGKQYTSEIIVSMQAKIDSPVPPVQENLSDVIKFGADNNLGNILDNNDNTIIAAINQINARQVDFSQVSIEKKDNHSATLTAKKDSKSYAGSVDVKYNIVPTTVVDLKIDLQPTSGDAIVAKDYVGQIDKSNITNQVNTFYYANSESKITMIKPTPSSVITGTIYGCDNKWNKTSQSIAINPTNGIVLDGSQLATNNGKYVVELSDNLGHINNIYLQIAPKQAIANYFDTNNGKHNGKQFEIWAKVNGQDNIRGYSASLLNKLFEESKNWQQIASDSQFATVLAEWYKTNGKLASKEPLTKEQVIAQLKTQIPSRIIIAGVNTSNYDPTKVEFEFNKSEFKPNNKANIVIKYKDVKSDRFTLQIKDSKTPDNKNGDSKLWIIGVVVGVLAFIGIVYLLFRKFVFNKYILPKIYARRQQRVVDQWEKEEREEAEKIERQQQDHNKKQNNNKDDDKGGKE